MTKFYGFGLVVAATVMLSGCTVSLGGSGAPDDSLTGGLFRSENFGQTWQQKVLVPTISGKPQSISPLETLSLRADPFDSNALYFGSLDQGLFFTDNAGESWRNFSKLGARPIASIAVDYSNKCHVYVASNEKILSTQDCGRTWQNIYTDTRSKILIYSVIADYYASSTIYMANSVGEVIKSIDGGLNWRTMYRLNDKISKLVMSPTDSRILMVATEGNLFKTVDGGETWTDMKSRFKLVGGINSFRDLVASKKQAGLWLMATRYGLLRTVNDGEDWVALQLITPEKKASINSVAISQQDVNKLYYATDAIFYSSMDAGLTWKSLRLPTPRRGVTVMTDAAIDGRIYLGTRRVAQ